jgi:hypothetical protein
MSSDRSDVVIGTTLYRTTADFIKQAKAGWALNLRTLHSSAPAPWPPNWARRARSGRRPGGSALRPDVDSRRQNTRPRSKSILARGILVYVAGAYICAKVLAEAIRRAGKNPDRESLLKALDSMSSYDVGGYIVSFSPTNHNGEVQELTQSAKGRFVLNRL